MREIFMRRIENQQATDFALKVHTAVKRIESEIESITGVTFESPLKMIKLGAWADYAYKMRKQSITGSALELLYKLLEDWYVALRLVCQSWEEEEQLVLQWLSIHDAFRAQGWYGPRLISS